jgi:hypothetical protein
MDIHIVISFFLILCKKKIALERLLLDRPRMSRYILDGLYNFVLFLLIIIKRDRSRSYYMFAVKLTEPKAILEV